MLSILVAWVWSRKLFGGDSLMKGNATWEFAAGV